MVWTRVDARIQKSGRSIPKPGRQNPNLGRKSIGMVVNPDTYFVAPFMKGPDGGIVCTTGYLANQAQKRFIDSYFKSIYPESFGRAWTLGGPPVPPSLVRRSGSPDLLVRSDREFSAVEGMPLESNLSKASQKSKTTETKKTSGTAMGVGLGLPAKIPDDAYGGRQQCVVPFSPSDRHWCQVFVIWGSRRAVSGARQTWNNPFRLSRASKA